MGAVALVQNHARGLAGADRQGADGTHERAPSEIERIADEPAEGEPSPGRIGERQLAVRVAGQVVQRGLVGESFVGVDRVEETHGAEVELHRGPGPVDAE